MNHHLGTGRTAVFASALLVAFAAQAQNVGLDGRLTQSISGAVSAGSTATVRVTFTNVGTVTTGLFQVTGGVSGASLNGVSGAGATCAKGRNSVYTCSLSSVPPGGSVDMIVSARVDNNAVTFTSSAGTANLADVNFADNRSTLSVPVSGPAPDLQLNAGASDRSPRAGSAYDYVFQVKSSGQPASGVSFIGTLPPEATLLGVGTSVGTVCTVDASGTVFCPLGDLASGGQAVVTVSVLAPATVGTTYSFTGVTAAADGRDANQSNNTGTVEVTTK